MGQLSNDLVQISALGVEQHDTRRPSAVALSLLPVARSRFLSPTHAPCGLEASHKSFSKKHFLFKFHFFENVGKIFLFFGSKMIKI